MLALTHVSNECIQALDTCLDHFRQVYPEASLVVIGDGVCGDYPIVAKKHGAEWVSGQQLKRTYRYPLWTDRLMQTFVDRPDDSYFLFDPDTKVWQRAKGLPDADCVGQLIQSLGGKIPTINSCAVWYSRSLVQRYFSVSRDVWLELPAEYKNEMFTRQAYLHDMWFPFILRRLNATISNFDGVGAAIGGEAPYNGDLKYAITHPHKTVASWSI